MFEVSNKEFKKLLKRYEGYAALYASLNNGSREGLTTFEEFYWRFSYLTKYDNPGALWQSGY